MAELNGTPTDIEDTSPLTLGNYGHYTAIRIDHHRTRGLNLHLERLQRDSRIIFGAELDTANVRNLIHRVAQKEGSFNVRVTVFDAAFDMAAPGANAELQILVTTRPAAALPIDPFRVQTTQYTRDIPTTKHVGILGAMWHRREARLNGFDDVLFLDRRSQISEGATWNIGFFDGSRVIWPESDYLPGITMGLLKQIHPGTDVRPVDTAALPGMRAAFATNVTVGVRAITAINDVSFPADHAIFDTLRKEYADIPVELI